MPVNFKVDWGRNKVNKQTNRRQKNNDRQNLKRKPHQYSVGDLVTVERPRIIPKLLFPRNDPYEEIVVHDDDTITLQKEVFVTDLLNIRRV